MVDWNSSDDCDLLTLRVLERTTDPSTPTFRDVKGRDHSTVGVAGRGQRLGVPAVSRRHPHPQKTTVPMTKPKTAVFHHPEPLSDEPTSGSEVRPIRMLEAFDALGYEMIPVTGFASDRRKAMDRVRDRLGEGDRIAFVYSEVSTTPTALTEPHHFPTHPLLEYRFFADLSEAGVPVGVFYRDVYWKFPIYDEKLSWPKRAVAKAFHVYDWWMYRRQVDHLFLPTLRMREYLHSPWPPDRVSALPPGCRIRDGTTSAESAADTKTLRLFYVGGIHPGVYDISPLLRTVAKLDGVELTLCCREKEWEAWVGYYSGHPGRDKVAVVHAHSEELEPYYAAADIAVDLRSFESYQRIMVPVKLFEALGHGVPYIATEGTAAHDIVQREGLGWSVGNESEFAELLIALRRNPERLERKGREVRRVRRKHTWRARASEAVDLLTEPNK